MYLIIGVDAKMAKKRFSFHVNVGRVTPFLKGARQHDFVKETTFEGKIWQITESKQNVGRVAETKYHSKDV